MPTKGRTWQDNAHEFGALTKQGYGVRLAVLVACSVEKGTIGAHAQPGMKTSGTNFAEEAGVGRSTVQRYLDKWDRMVKAGWEVDRSDLTPASVLTLELSEQFIEEFDALATAGPAGSSLTGKAADIAQNPTAMTTAIRSDPKVAQAAMDAILSEPMTAKRVIGSPGVTHRIDSVRDEVATEKLAARGQFLQHREPEPDDDSDAMLIVGGGFAKVQSLFREISTAIPDLNDESRAIYLAKVPALTDWVNLIGAMLSGDSMDTELARLLERTE